MSDETTPKGKSERVPTSTQGILVRDLLKEQARKAKDDADRDERKDKVIIDALEKQASNWFRIAVMLVAVLAMLVSGIVGVGITGKIPGVGNLTITPSAHQDPSEP